MKKYILSAIFLGLASIMPNIATAGSCQIYSCGGSDSINANANGQGSQCYYCNDSYAGDKQCDGGAIVGQTDAQGRIIQLQQCHTSTFNDSWQIFNPGRFCQNSDIQVGNPDEEFPNAYKSYSLNGGTKTIGYVSGDDTVLKAGNTACVYIKCNDGFKPDAKKEKCIDAKLNPNCMAGNPAKMKKLGEKVPTVKGCAKPSKTDTDLLSREHLKSDAICDSVCAANGWNVTLRADSCMEGYEPDSTKKKCVPNQATRDQNAQRQREENNRRDNAAKKQACENSGGTWSGNKCNCDASKNLRTENNVCVCLDNENYKRVGDHCELTDAAALQRKCEAAASAGAYWNGTYCACTDAKKIWNGATCIMNPDIEACGRVNGAEWRNGVCVCKDENKELNEAGTACVETEEARQRREETAQADRVRLSMRKISEAGGTLTRLKDGLETSVWKNKDGKFNTSRLASDSIAAVVLGTAGGLITSNVIKKNQVKGGFEDITCTVGGQVVAGWGDEFRVGIH